MTEEQENRIKAQVLKHSSFCSLDPEDFNAKDVKLISEYAKVKPKHVWEYLNHWHHS